MNFGAALPTFVITLREGVEAALIVGIVLAYLKRADRTELGRWVWAGVGGGLAASVVVGWLFRWFIGGLSTVNQKYAPVIEPLLEGVFSLLAIGMLSWMLVWMTRQARSLKGQVEGTIAGALQTDAGAGWAILSLVLFAVLREGFETVLFIASLPSQGLIPVLGAVLGVASSALLATLLFKWGVKIDLRLFFKSMGILLLLIVSGLVVSALGHFDTAIHILASLDRASEGICFYGERFVRNASCILGPKVWDGARFLPDDRFPGIVLGALFGYAERLYLVQVAGYAVFLVTVGSLYFKSLTGRSLFAEKARKPVPVKTPVH